MANVGIVKIVDNCVDCGKRIPNLGLNTTRRLCKKHKLLREAEAKRLIKNGGKPINDYRMPQMWP